MIPEQDRKDPTGTTSPEDVTSSAQPVENEPLSMEADVEQLRREIEEKDAEVCRLQDRLLRERAELENFKKRMQREKAEALRFACEPLIRDLLPVIDNLERALAFEEGNGQSVRDGVRMVVDSLRNVLSIHGVQDVDAVGQTFDPAKHEALAQVASDVHPPNQVVEQLHRGYLLHDRLLRPALVTVSGGTPGGGVRDDGTVESGESND
jgi:molecular chaperone GrpE